MLQRVFYNSTNNLFSGTKTSFSGTKIGLWYKDQRIHRIFVSTMYSLSLLQRILFSLRIFLHSKYEEYFINYEVFLITDNKDLDLALATKSSYE